MTGIALAINADPPVSGNPVYAAQAFRLAMTALLYPENNSLAGRSGVRPMAADVVTLAGSTITVAQHSSIISPNWSGLTGSYLCALSVAETHSLTAAHATNPRLDIVIGRVYDHDENPAGLRLYRSEYIAGVAAGSPVAPSVPQGAVRLATISVPQSGGGSPSVSVDYNMAGASLGVLPVRSDDGAQTDWPGTPYPGQMVFSLPDGEVYVRVGSGWRVVGVASISGTSDRPPGFDGAVAYRRDNDTLEIRDGSGIWRRVAVSLETFEPTETLEKTAQIFTSTSYAGGSPVCGHTFVAPPSGKVKITVSGFLQNNINDNRTFLSVQVRTGGVIGAGSDVLLPHSDHALASPAVVLTGVPTSVTASYGPFLLQGLTPGNTYNIRTMHTVSPAGSGTADERRVMTDPVL